MKLSSFLILSLLFISISCKKILLIPETEICGFSGSEKVYSPNDTTFSGICTIFQNGKSLKATLTVSILNRVTKIILMDELGVPLLLTSDSLNIPSLIRRFPPLNDDEAFLAGIAATATLRRPIALQKAQNGCNYIRDLKSEKGEVLYSQKDNEKDLTKIVHNNDFYLIHHYQENQNVLKDIKGTTLVTFSFNQ